MSPPPPHLFTVQESVVDIHMLSSYNSKTKGPCKDECMLGSGLHYFTLTFPFQEWVTDLGVLGVNHLT